MATVRLSFYSLHVNGVRNLIEDMLLATEGQKGQTAGIGHWDDASAEAGEVGSVAIIDVFPVILIWTI